MSATELRQELKDKLEPTINRLNEVLGGVKTVKLEPVLARIGRGGKLPHWYAQLKANKSLPNLDGKTIGSVVEMLLVGVLETFTFAERNIRLRVNPARGTDLPDLDLGVKSPSTNYCTSEPFFSAYERLIGNKHDALVLLTDYQEKKDKPPLKLQIARWRYLERSEIADESLCKLAMKNRAYLLETNEVWARKFFRFLAHVNQSDWRARHLLKMAAVLTEQEKVPNLIGAAVTDFASQNKKFLAKNRAGLPDSELQAVVRISDVNPVALGIIDALDSWVEETLQEAGRMPGADEWKLLKEGPLNGKIGMSFALQWRFNFAKVFNAEEDDAECVKEELTDLLQGLV